MATATKTWSFLSNAEGWTAVPAGAMVMAWTDADGSPAAGCLQNRLPGKNQNPGNCYWYINSTWENLFGIPPGSTVTEVGTAPNADYNSRCTEYATVTTANTGPFELYNSVPQLQGTFSAAFGYDKANGWALQDGVPVAVPEAIQASNSAIQLRLNVHLRTGASTAAVVTIRQDQIVLTITYAPPTAGWGHLLSDRRNRLVGEHG